MAEEAIRLTLKTAVGDYSVTLTMAKAQEYLANRYVMAADLDAQEVARWLAVNRISNAMKADSGPAGADESPYLNYKTDSGDWVSLRSTAIIGVEARVVPVERGMGFGSINSDIPPEKA